MGMYDDIVSGVSENVEIGGYPFYAENIRGEEPFNRREYTFKPILNGTLSARRGKYIQRKFSFKTTVYHSDGRHDSFDKVLASLNSKPVHVISKAMGGTFKAIVTFDRSIDEGSKYHTDYDVSVLEVPDKKSKISGEAKLTVPNIKKVKITNKSSKSSGKTSTLISSKTNKNLNNTLKKCKVPFKKGQKNKCVKTLQEKLISLGFLNKKYKTGKYDAKTIEAVKAFQRSTHGKLVVDGVFGKYTRNMLVKVNEGGVMHG